MRRHIFSNVTWMELLKVAWMRSCLLYTSLNEQEATEIEFYMNRILQIRETQKTAFGNDLLRKFVIRCV